MYFSYGRTIRVNSVGDFKLISSEYHQSDGSVIVKGMNACALGQ